MIASHSMNLNPTEYFWEWYWIITEDLINILMKLINSMSIRLKVTSQTRRFCYKVINAASCVYRRLLFFFSWNGQVDARIIKLTLKFINII